MQSQARLLENIREADPKAFFRRGERAAANETAHR